ncbi:DNA-3-methyladenine glycosylase family protein [Eilatimonas milleporae]|uniref:DNA-3-methyladenine glycosylase II n=1 Tax=Eilatimonas milleporae TaxID=911205 RepID=A0A3M0BV49_9PROT|nr:DNA-3-methyladenine glycosylase [Eilatimonas milleporae]RMB01451.1 DNA-3-methyladenine glycosylase II [Eilatimonas milleporae]
MTDKQISFGLSTPRVAAMLSELAEEDSRFKKAIATAGMPAERKSSPGMATLIRIIIGQQVSTRAAASIAGRLFDLIGETPDPAYILSQSDEALRAAGLSRAKVLYVQCLAEAIGSGTLDLDGLGGLPDEDAVAALTAIKGFGRWSAEMYLMFALGRPDIWPVGDLAVRIGTARILGLDNPRPAPKDLEALSHPWRPKRSAVALLAWHYQNNVPL